MNILVTGGTGLLGRWFSNSGLVNASYYSHKTLDITEEKSIDNAFKDVRPKIVLHLAAYTNVFGAELERELCYKVNVIGTRNVVNYCKKYKSKIVYISTEYVFDGEKGNYFENDECDPVNYYGVTKLEGEKEVLKYNNSVIIRTLFKPRPFKHNVVPIDMWTSGDYIDKIGKELIIALTLIDKLPHIIHIGLNRKNLYELAKESLALVRKTTRKDLLVPLPRDASLNSYLWEKIKYDSRIKTNNR